MKQSLAVSCQRTVGLCVGLVLVASVSRGQTFGPMSGKELKELEEMQRDLRVVLLKWANGGTASDAIWKVKIQNRGKVEYRDIQYNTVYVVPSGSRFVGSKDGVIRGVLLPGKSIAFDVNSGSFPPDMKGSHPGDRAEYRGGSGTVDFKHQDGSVDQGLVFTFVIATAKR